MPNDAAIAQVICPFFHRFTKSGKEIVCEGFAKNMEAGTLFPDHDALEVWTGKLCNTFQYSACPVAKAAERLH